MEWTEIVVEIITVVGLIVVAAIGARTGKRQEKADQRQEETARHVKAILTQTENEHELAEYPNLRDELTATRESVEALARSQARTNKLTEDYIRDVDKSAAASQKSLERHTALAEARLDEIPRLIEMAIKTHSTTCPLVTREQSGDEE